MQMGGFRGWHRINDCIESATLGVGICVPIGCALCRHAVGAWQSKIALEVGIAWQAITPFILQYPTLDLVSLLSQSSPWMISTIQGLHYSCRSLWSSTAAGPSGMWASMGVRMGCYWFWWEMGTCQSVLQGGWLDWEVASPRVLWALTTATQTGFWSDCFWVEAAFLAVIATDEHVSCH